MSKLRTNKRNAHLPERWRWIKKSIYYSVPKGSEEAWDGKQTFKLGDNLSEACQVWADRMPPESPRTAYSSVDKLLNDYLLLAVPAFSPPWRALCNSAIINIKKSFGNVRPSRIDYLDIRRYLTLRSHRTKNAQGKWLGGATIANREIEIFQAAVHWAVKRGAIREHPFKGKFDANKESARTRYVKDWEIEEMMKVGTHRRSGSVHSIKAYIKIKLLTGMAKGDILRLTQSDLKNDGIHIRRHKTNHKGTIYEWIPELRTAVDEAIAARPCTSPYLFCNKYGKCYFNEATGEARGWKTMWQNFIIKVMSETKITEHFVDHDLRAKVGSDIEDIENARKALSHASSSTTRKHYRRKPEIVHTGTH